MDHLKPHLGAVGVVQAVLLPRGRLPVQVCMP